MKPVTRREFLRTLSACACAGAATRILVPFNGKLAHAATSCGLSKRTVVDIYLAGGADKMSFVPPKNLASYLAARPTIGVASPLDIVIGGITNTQVGLHPNLGQGAAGNFRDHMNAGRIALILGSGTPNHSNSHEFSEAVYASGVRNPNPYGQQGWASRLASHYCVAGDNLAVFSFRGNVQEVIGGDFVAASSGSLALYGFVDEAGANANESRYRRAKASEILGLDPSTDEQFIAFRNARGAVDNTVSVVQAANTAYTAWAGKATYSNDGLSQRLRDTAALIYGGLNPTAVLLSVGGWDDHGTIMAAGQFPARVTNLSNAIRSFMQDISGMAGLGLISANDVLINIYTEFARTNFENSNAGVDHARAGLHILVGYGVAGGVYGGSYSNDDFNGTRNHFPTAVDFREIKSQIYAHHLGIDPTIIHPEAYDNIGGLPQIVSAA